MISPIEPILMQLLSVSGPLKIVIPNWWRPIIPKIVSLSHSWSRPSFPFVWSPPYTLLTCINQNCWFIPPKYKYPWTASSTILRFRHLCSTFLSQRPSVAGKEYWFLKLHVNYILCQSLWSCLPHCFSRYMLPAAEKRPRAANAITVEFSMFR